MNGETRWLAPLVLGALIAGSTARGDSAEVNAALKQVSQAIAGVRGVVAQVHYSEVVGKRSIDGSGTIYVNFAGLIRAEIEGEMPRTVLYAPPYLYTHRHAEQVVEVRDVSFNAELLGQYLLLGFNPAGKALKKEFDVQLVENSTLDGAPVLGFLITPKKKDKEAARSIARIQLWVDPVSGLPRQHEIVHGAGETKLVVRYLSLSREDAQPASRFQPDWPTGTVTLRN